MNETNKWLEILWCEDILYCLQYLTVFSADMWIFYGIGIQSVYIVSGCGIRLVRSMKCRRRGAS